MELEPAELPVLAAPTVDVRTLAVLVLMELLVLVAMAAGLFPTETRKAAVEAGAACSVAVAVVVTPMLVDLMAVVAVAAVPVWVPALRLTFSLATARLRSHSAPQTFPRPA